MASRDKLLGRQPLWAGTSFFGPQFFAGPRLPRPSFWVGFAIGAVLIWWL